MPDGAEEYSLINIAADRDREVRRRCLVVLRHVTHQAELAAARHPELKDELQSVVNAYHSTYENYVRQVIAAHTTALDSNHLKEEMKKLNEERYKEICKLVTQEHPATGGKGLKALIDQMRPESIFTPIARLFHNSDRPDGRAGFQLGAIGSGIGLAGVVNYLTTGTGWFIRTLATIAAFIVGGFAGHKIIDGDDPPPVTPDFHSSHPLTRVSSLSIPAGTISPSLHAAAGSETDGPVRPTTTPMVATNGSAAPMVQA